MASFFVLTSVAITSFAACVIAITVFRGAMSDLHVALARACECIGLGALFLVANVVVQIVMVFVFQTLTSLFVSLHLVGDSTLIALSMMQGVTFRWWRARQLDSAGRR